MNKQAEWGGRGLFDAFYFCVAPTSQKFVKLILMRVQISGGWPLICTSQCEYHNLHNRWPQFWHNQYIFFSYFSHVCKWIYTDSQQKPVTDICFSLLHLYYSLCFRMFFLKFLKHFIGCQPSLMRQIRSADNW